MPNTNHEAEPIAAEAATIPDFSFDPLASHAKSWDEYYTILNKRAFGRRHYAGPAMLRDEDELWIEGQSAVTTVWERRNYRLEHNVDWMCFETKQFRSERRRQADEGREKYRDMLRRRREFKQKLAQNFARDTARYHRWDDYIFPRELRPAYTAAVRAEGQSMGKLMGMTRLLLKKGLFDQANEHAWELRFRFSHYAKPMRFLEAYFESNILHASLPNSSGVRKLLQLGVVCPATKTAVTRLNIVAQMRFQDRIRLCKSHFLHQSLDDPLQVAYAPSYAYFSKDRWVRTTLGRYLTRFFGEFLTEAEIREAANAYTEANKPIELHLVPNTDPDGWAWVYENGSGFASCMTASRKDRVYIDSHVLSSGHHPVKAYACNHPDNHLALAYIGKPGSVAWARSIVNLKHKTYLRVYGDDRLKGVLKREGFAQDSAKTLIGEVMQAAFYRLEYPDNPRWKDHYVLPYLDAGGYDLIDPENKLVQVIEGGTGASAAAVVILHQSIMVQCCHCQTEHRYNESRLTNPITELTLYSTPEAKRYACTPCLNGRYVHGYHDPNQAAGFMLKDEAISPDGGDTYYHKQWLASWGVIEFEGGWVNKNSLVYLCGEDRYIRSNISVRLGHNTVFPGKEPQIYAHIDDTVMDCNGRYIHKRDVVRCIISGQPGHPSGMFRIGENEYVLPDHFRLKPWLFAATSKTGSLTVFITFAPDGAFEESLAQYLIDHAAQRDNIVYENIINGARISPVRDYGYEALEYARREKARRTIEAETNAPRIPVQLAA